MVLITDLSKSFKTDAGVLDVLKGINMEIGDREMISIMGASGAGKSTLLHVMGTLDRPTSGIVSFNGQDVFSLDDKKLAAFRNKTIGFIFQFHNLLQEFNTLENTMMPALISGINREEIAEKAAALLTELGLKERLTHRPAELSGGEQQRVAVARALILDPLVVLADEPTGNLDTKTGEHLIEIMLKMNQNKGTTFIIVTHNESFAKKTQKIYHMEDGRLLN
ncbi:ABC transporter ATP-binding protein [Candidatus Magnetomonas plexicatena]|nr:ABC transporter ATP-binding protein [Nitrospirales bacterium LBB_01]